MRNMCLHYQPVLIAHFERRLAASLIQTYRSELRYDYTTFINSYSDAIHWIRAKSGSSPANVFPQQATPLIYSELL